MRLRGKGEMEMLGVRTFPLERTSRQEKNNTQRHTGTFPTHPPAIPERKEQKKKKENQPEHATRHTLFFTVTHIVRGFFIGPLTDGQIRQTQGEGGGEEEVRERHKLKQ